MKNTIKVFGIIALVAVIGFSMSACGDDGGNNGGNGSNPFIGTWSPYGSRRTIAILDDSSWIRDPTYMSGTYTRNGNSATFTGTEIPAGTAITFTVTYTKLDYAEPRLNVVRGGRDDGFFKSGGVPQLGNVSIEPNGNDIPTGTTLTAAYYGSFPPVTYQWRRDGREIPGENDRSILADEPGAYGVAVSAKYFEEYFETKYSSAVTVVRAP